MTERCEGCGADVPDGARFCGQCGRAVDPEVEAPAEAKSAGHRVVVVVAALAVVAALTRLITMDGSDESARSEPINLTRTVTYEVTGTAEGADLTTGINGKISQHRGKAVPLCTPSGTCGINFTVSVGDFVQLSAQNTGSSGTIVCVIKVDGIVVDRNASSGGYTIAGCSARVA